MSKEVILDVRSGERNDSGTGLCLRSVRGGVEFLEGVGYIRRGYDLYSMSVGSEYVLISSGDGEIGIEGGVCRFVSLGGGKWLTNIRGWVREVRVGGVVLPHYFGGSVVESDLDLSDVEGEYDLVEGGVGFWWSRNDDVRTRFSYEDGGWKLLKGGAGYDLGVIGDGEMVLGGGLSGELRIGGSNSGDISVEVYEIGGEEIPLVSEGEEEGVLGGAVLGVVLNPSGKVIFREGYGVGKRVFYVCGELGALGSALVGADGYLAPKPLRNEYPLLRQSGYGYSRILFVETEGDLGEWEYGVVKVSLDSGRILSESEVIFDGLVLCDSPVGVGSGVDLGNEIGVVDGVPIESIPDGSGLEPEGLGSSFRSDGSGCKWGYFFERMYVSIGSSVLPVEIVDSLPKRLEKGLGYVIRGTRRVYLNKGWKKSVLEFGHRLYGGHVGFSRGGLPHVSGFKLSGSGGFRVDGELVEYEDGELTSGFDKVTLVDGGHLLLLGDLDYPSDLLERESLRGLGLVSDGSLETGLEVILTRSQVSGYYEFSGERVGEISGVGAFQMLQFEPRVDFSGYGAGEFFKVGDKVLGEGEIEGAFGLFPNGFHWVRERIVSGVLSEETSRLLLGSGLRLGSTGINVSQEQIDGSILSEDLVEGLDYDLPSGGIEGQARLLKRLGGEKLRGQRVEGVEGLEVDLGVDLGSCRAGDFYFDGYSYFKIEAVGEGVLTISSMEGFVSGAWKIYEGYREGLVESLDPTKVVGEIFDDLGVLERSSVEVYKVYGTLAFEKVLPSSKLFIRSGDETYPLVVLRDEVLSSPYELPIGDHTFEGSYRIKVSGIEYEVDVAQNGYSFSVENNRVVFKSGGIEDTSWLSGEVIYVRKPRTDLTTIAEMDIDLNLSSPFEGDVFEDFLELLSSPNVESSSGAISFEEPLDEGVGVEVSYTPLDDPSQRVIEVMGFSVVQEEAVRGDNAYEFTYNALGKEIELLVRPSVFVGSELISTDLYYIDERNLRFSFAVSEDTSVKVSYTTLKSNGGDAVVRTSSGMVIPKYKIDKGTTSLSVHRDLTETLGSGDLIRVGTHLFNVVSVSLESIEVNPPARFNIETDKISYLNVPSFSYEGVESSYAFRLITGAKISSKPKSSDIYIQGDYRDYIRASSICVLEGVPYRVKVVSLDGSTGVTKVSVEGFSAGHDFVSTDDFFVSFRAVLVEGETELSLSTGIISTEDYQFIKYDHVVGRGSLLKEGSDYKLNAESGIINLVGGHRVVPQVSYYLLHTALSGVKPFTLLGGRVSKPTYRATFKQSVVPVEYKGLDLNAKCVVSSPDTFQVRIVDEEVYSSEVANELLNNYNQGQGTGGKFVISSSLTQGKGIGVYDLLANDVVVRSRINLYNGYIQPIDDLTSTTTGKVVGDSDGSFKFNLLTSGDWIAPGLEDAVTREIYPRYVSMEFLTPLNLGNPYPSSEDPILIGGEPPTAPRLALLLEQQRALIENEMDDFVLIGQREKTTLDFGVGFPYLRYEYTPVYKAMWERHRFSRLFPTSTKMYSYRVPGELNSSTNGVVIANVQNNAIGQIENITSLPVVKRRASRFRVYDFSPNGFPSINPSSSGKPTFIVSALPLDEFPIDPATGLPDTTQFLSEGGSLADIIVGNVDKTFNGLQVGSKVQLSRGGDFYRILNTAQNAILPDLGLFPPLIATEPRNAVVSALLSGCLVVLEGNAFNLKINDESLIEHPPKRGDTLIESFVRDLDDSSSPVTTFRVGSDIGLKSATGELVDISLPSASDPDWPIKEIVGQNVPGSGLALEGDVEFLYGETKPFKYPALEGQALNDSGDESLPYMSRFNERDLLPQIPPILNNLKVQTLNHLSGLNEYVYPDEARGIADIENGVLTTDRDFSSLNGVCEQSVRQGDLVLLTPDTSGVGILEVGLIEGDKIYPPSFETPAKIRCRFDNVFVELANEAGKGVLIFEEWLSSTGTDVLDYTRTEFTWVGLPPNTIGNLFESATADMIITMELHSLNAPYSNDFTFNFIYDGVDWSVQLINNVTQVTRTWDIVVEVNSASNSIVVIQQVRNAYDPSFDTWLNYDDMESWLFNEFTDFWVQTLYSSQVGFITGVTGTGNSALYDYRVSVIDLEAQINTNRVEIDFTDTTLTTWFYINEVANPYDTEQRFIIENSYFVVKEEGGVQVQEIRSDVNDETFLISDVNIKDDTTLRVERLRGLTILNQPMSIFIGSEVDETDMILYGTASNGLINSTGTSEAYSDVLRNITPQQGSLAQVNVGDLVYIQNGHNAGTHRVKEILEVAIDEEFNEALGVSEILPVVFPRVVSLTDNGDDTATLETDVDDLSLYFTDSLFILLNDNYLSTPESNRNNVYDQTWGQSIVHVVLDSISGSSAIFTEDTRNNHENPHFLDGDHGNSPTNVTIAELALLLGNGGQLIAGHTRIPFDINKTDYVDQKGSINFVGLDIAFTIAGGSLTGNVTLTEADLERAETGEVIAVNLPQVAELYPNIEDIPQGNIYHEAFITPNDVLTFRLEKPAGLYLDPTFPRLFRDYSNVVEFNDGTTQIRSAIDYTLQSLPAWDFSEQVTFVVRRLRRFTDVFSKLIYAFEGFRYLYEQRVGRVDSVVKNNAIITLTPFKVNGYNVVDPTGTDTQVGEFTHVVSAGDHVQCFNSSNQETLYLRVLEVGATLQCSVVRGALSDVSNGDLFKIITRLPLIPELQSFDQFVSHGFTEIYSTSPQAGISVDEINVLTDLNANFTTLGVTEGDFLVIDPQGLLTGTLDEYGSPPQGDNGDGTLGLPNNLDDNRGAYLVRSVDSPNTLTVEFYAGSSGTTRTGYKLLPSVSGDDTQPLRITSEINGGTYGLDNNSVGPFSYRILRRNETLSEELAGSILFFRERTMSWVEQIKSFNQLPTQPYTWTQYENESLIDDVGLNDRSHPSNEILLQSILGNEGVQPFENNETCLSVFDRRMLIGDPKMLSEGYGESEDSLSEVLLSDISSMNATANRYAWISLRTDLVEGTLAKLSRIDLSNPDDTALEDIKK